MSKSNITDEARILRDALRRYAAQTLGSDRSIAEQLVEVIPDDLTASDLSALAMLINTKHAA